MIYSTLTTAYILIGAYAIAAQIYFIRELLVIFFGNELCLGIIFAVWFMGIGIGALAGGRAGKKQKQPACLFLSALCVFSLLPFYIVPLIRVLRVFFAIPPGGYASIAHMAAGCFLTVCPFSFMAGFLFPLACRALSIARSSESLNIGWVYVWESAGSFAGGLLIACMLIPKYSPLLVFGWGALLIFAAALVLIFSLKSEEKLRPLKIVLPALLAADMLLLAVNAFPAFDAYLQKVRWETFNNSLRLVESRDSPYHNIVLAEAGGQYSIFLNGTLLSSYPDEYQAALKAHLFLSQHPKPGHVLLVGGSAGGLLKEVLKHPVLSVDCVELDPEIIRTIIPCLKAEDRKALGDSRVTVFYMDGRLYVKKAEKKYDLIIVDVPDPSTAFLNRLYTIDFFSEVRKILSESGIFITGMSSPANYVSREFSDYNGSLYHGLLHVFPCVMVVPAEKNYFFAGNRSGLFSNDHEELFRRYESRNIHSEYFSPALFEWLVQKDRIEFMQGALAGRGGGALNTDFRPVTYFYNLVIWDIVSGYKSSLRVFQKIKKPGLLLLTGGLGLFFLACCMAAAKKPKQLAGFSCFGVIMTTGYAAMAVEIVLIFMFQNLYGYIYEKIGLVVALFMLGLAAGSFCMRGLLKRYPGITLGTLMALELIVCAYIFALPFILESFAEAQYAGKQLLFITEYLCCALVFIMGLLAGMEFPLVCHVLVGSGYNGSSVAGWIDSLDHIGACGGAFLTGVFFVPLLGTAGTCFASALLKGIFAVLLGITFIKLKKYSARGC